MLSGDTPLTSDSSALHNELDFLGCVNSSWLTTDPLLDLWLQSARHDPDTFFLIEESFFSLHEAKTLQEYRLGIKIYRMLISDSLLHRKKIEYVCISKPATQNENIYL